MIPFTLQRTEAENEAGGRYERVQRKMEQSTIVIVDDDEEIKEVVSVLLSSEGYRVLKAGSGNEAVALLESGEEKIDLIILDVMMPDMDGYQVCRKIKELSIVPVLFLTAKSREQDMVDSFLSGGDDYIAKPFSYAELVARVGALLRRFEEYRNGGRKKEEEEIVRIGDICIDKKMLSVTKEDKEIELTNTEYGILLLLAENRGRVFSLQEIYENVWKDMFLRTASNTVMVHIRNLREKLRIKDEDELIKNKWGKGYYIE